MGIEINVDVSVKIQENIICVKRIIFGILNLKMVNIWEVLLIIQ